MCRIVLSCLTLLLPVIVHAQNNSLFKKLPPEQTGLRFVNKLVETPQSNIITYEYFYNGGGVAAGDFNNDGLIDLYFVANKTENKLYLNKGNWQFEDITHSSGVEGRPGWKTGVTVADVNGDGWLDIYVCYSGDLPPEKRRNQLFINNGKLGFKDEAEAYGVADEGYTTQAAFFDYDRDGDLDLFVLNHNIKSFRNFDAAFVKKMVDKDAGDHLYRNDNGKFTDVTAEAGIIANPLGYGLGIGVSDLNNDGWPDLYVSNDYVEEDYLYLNNGNGTFSERLKEELGHISNFSMGLDIADINNDGWTDIFTLDMLPEDNKRQKLLYTPDNYELYNNTVNNGFHHQLMRNMLQLNNGDGSFSEIGQLAGISNTDWSWSALFADFNNDGNKDLFVSNGYGRDMINRDFVKFYANERLKYSHGQQDERMFQVLQGIKSTPMRNYLFMNDGQLNFRDSTESWGITDLDFSQGAVYADLDNDGDLDLVVNRMNDYAAVYRNQLVESKRPGNYINLVLKMPGKNPNAIGARVKCYSNIRRTSAGRPTDAQPQGIIVQEKYPVHGFQSSMEGPLHIGLPSDKIDSLQVFWPNGKMQTIKTAMVNTTSTINYDQNAVTDFHSIANGNNLFVQSNKTIPFKHTEDDANDFKIQPLMPNMISYSGPPLAKADINNDGREDIYIGGASGQAGALFIQGANGEFVPVSSDAFKKDGQEEDIDAIFFDADNDKDFDLYVVSDTQDRLYINDKGRFIRSKGSLPQENLHGSCVRAADFDMDGDLDLFVGTRCVDGKYPETPESMILVNDGKGNFSKLQGKGVEELTHQGMITDALWMDLNKDGRPDLVLCGEWMPVTCFLNLPGGFVNATKQYFPDDLNGWWNRLASADLDGDGDLDLVAANWGTNSQIKVSKDEPATIHYADFDQNGSIDPIICYFIQHQSYPMASRDEITDQVVSLRQKFPTYDSYSEATLADCFSPEQLKQASILVANDFETVWLENRGDKFVKHSLPVQANYAPVYAIGISDYNNDGYADILLAGNVDQTRIKIGKIDANYGELFLGDGKGGFRYLPQLRSGLCVKGCVRNLVSLNGGDKNLLVFGINNQSPVIYQYKANKK